MGKIRTRGAVVLCRRSAVVTTTPGSSTCRTDPRTNRNAIEAFRAIVRCASGGSRSSSSPCLYPCSTRKTRTVRGQNRSEGSCRAIRAETTIPRRSCFGSRLFVRLAHHAGTVEVCREGGSACGTSNFKSGRNSYRKCGAANIGPLATIHPSLSLHVHAIHATPCSTAGANITS